MGMAALPQVLRRHGNKLRARVLLSALFLIARWARCGLEWRRTSCGLRWVTLRKLPRLSYMWGGNGGHTAAVA